MASKIRFNRIMHEHKLMNKSNGDNNIYYYTNDEDINIVYIMLIGPENTPYSNGFYFFRCIYPDNYPYEPLKVLFLTTDGKTRMNPNLYQSGKLCLSILNTWSGPSWTSCQNIISVFLSILCEVFIDNPLRNEPGMDNSSKKQNKQYNDYILHENLRMALINNLKNPINEYFKNIMLQHLQKHRIEYKKYFDSISIDDKILCTPLWNIQIANNYEYLINELNNLI